MVKPRYGEDANEGRGQFLTRPKLRMPRSRLNSRKIWVRLQGKSVSALTSETESVDDVDKVLGQLGQTTLLVKIGRLIAVDVFSGNTDRINTNKTNLGNLMVVADRLSAIDNEINIGLADRDVALRTSCNSVSQFPLVIPLQQVNRIS